MGISKAYGKKNVLSDISFSVPQGCITAVIGKNGSGKSTLLSIAAGMLKPDRGDVRYHGQSILTNRQIVRQIGFATQHDHLFEDMTVRDNLTFWAAAAKVPLRSVDGMPILSRLGLPAFQKKKVHQLSGGMKRRVTLGIALLTDPSLVILDEPFAGLDLYYKNELANCLILLKEMGKAVLYTSHNGDEIAGLCDHMIVINEGQLIFNGSADTLQQYDGNLNHILLQLIKGVFKVNG